MRVDIPVNYNFKSYQILTTVRADVPVTIRAAKNLDGTMLLVNYWSGQGSFSELPMLSIVRVDIPVDYGSKSYKILSTVAIRVTKNLEGTMLPVNYWS